MSRVSRWRAGALWSLIAVVACALRPGWAEVITDEVAHVAWASVLTRFVDEQGRVDFHGLSRDDAQLNAYVDWLGEVGPTTAPERFPDRNAELAYHINAYNALAMHGIVARGIPDGFHSLFSRARFFRLRGITVDGRRTNLYHYENEVIRAYDEPRVHFALNCMSAGCPRLPREPFRPDALDAQLEAAAREFFASPRHLEVLADTRTVRVSEILDFFTEDFLSERTPTLIAYINQYRDEPVPADYRIEFIPYDWTTNQVPH